MKFKCAYCKKIIEDNDAPSVCPHCKKTMIVPDNLREKKFRDRKKDREKILLAADRERERIFTPDFQFGKRPANLFVVLGILAVVGATLIFQASKDPEPPSEVHRIQRADRELTVLRIALERFKADCGRYPRQDEGLDALFFDPNIEGWGGVHRWRYISKIKPDQWRMPYQYAISNGVVSVYSFGPDKTPHTSDDIYGTLPETNTTSQAGQSSFSGNDDDTEDAASPDYFPVNIGRE